MNFFIYYSVICILLYRSALFIYAVSLAGQNVGMTRLGMYWNVLCLILWQLWANYEEKPTEEVAQVSEEKERVANYRPVYVTEITDGMHFYTQDVETGE